MGAGGPVMLKIAALMLLVLAGLAFFGRLRLKARKPKQLTRLAKCQGCGRPRIGQGACDCGHRP